MFKSSMIPSGLVISLVFVLGAQVHAQNEHLIGKKVMIIEWEIEARKGNTIVRKLYPGEVYEVTKVNQQWLWFNNTVGGWVMRKHVVPYDQAIDHFNRLIEKNPTARNYISRARALLALGEIDKAIGDYDEAIRLDPKDGSAYGNRGLGWATKGNHEKAIADYTEAIRLDPKESLNYLNRGISWHNKGDLEKAISDYSEAAKLNPKLATAFRNRGAAWSHKGNHEKAIKDYSNALRIDPTDIFTYFNRGLTWKETSNYQEAIADFNEIIRIDPNYAAGYNALAWLLATVDDKSYRDGAQAVKHATKACELTNWKNDSYVDTLSAGYAAAGDFESAKKWLGEATKLNPDAYKEARQKMLAAYEAEQPYIE